MSTFRSRPTIGRSKRAWLGTGRIALAAGIAGLVVLAVLGCTVENPADILCAANTGQP